MANLTPLALATLYALAKGNKDEDGTAPAQQAPQAAPAMPAPVNIQRPRTDMSQMFGATQDTEDMEAAPPVVAAPSKKPVPSKTTTKPTVKTQRTPRDYDFDTGVAVKDSVATYNKPGFFDYDPTKTAQYKFGDKELRKKMLINEGMDPSIADQPGRRNPRTGREYAKGGSVKAYAKGGQVSAGRRGDGIASKGHTRGKMV
jgi:hypothetical protein